MSNLEKNLDENELKENQNVELMECAGCGSKLRLNSLRQKIVLCEYCGVQNIIKNNESNNFKAKFDKIFQNFGKKSTDPEKELKKQKKEEEKKQKAELKQEKKEEKKESSLEEKRIKNKNKLEIYTEVYINQPSVRVDREEFLRECFSNRVDNIDLVIEKGPVEAGVSEKLLRRIGENLITDRSSKVRNFVVYKESKIKENECDENKIEEIFDNETISEENEKLCLSLKLAQELVYLYGVKDIKNIKNDNVRKCLLSYLRCIIDAPKLITKAKDVVVGLLKAKIFLAGALKEKGFFVKKKGGKKKKIKKKKNIKNKKILKPTNPNKIKNKLQQKNKSKLFNKENLKNGAKGVMGVAEKFTNSKILDFQNSATCATTVLLTKNRATNLLKNLENVVFHNAEVVITDDEDMFEILKNETEILEIAENDFNVKNEIDEFEQIKKLKQLLDIGAITEEEFEKKKKMLLGL